MSDVPGRLTEEEITSRTIETLIRVGLVLLLMWWCFMIMLPFLIPVVWGVIIAVAIFPLFTKLQAVFGGSAKSAAIFYSLLALALLITPTVMISGSFVDTTQALLKGLDEGTLLIPPPNVNVKEWPLIGGSVYDIWHNASVNLGATVKQYSQQIKKLLEIFFAAAKGAGGGVLQFIISIIISGVLLTKAAACHDFTLKFFIRLSGEQNGRLFTDLAGATIRSVAQGVLGVAIIQSVLAGVGMYAMGVPGWGLWTVLVLVLAVAQLPPILVLGPVIAYVFSVADSTPALMFMVWSIVVSVSDGFLKPLFLGRGMETPMLVILLGAIGGMIFSGIIGLFVGAIVLALGYELFIAWLDKASVEAAMRQGGESATD